ncbi:MAG: 50S ribosomal protein L11 methyltransferase [Chitinophagaceae bacterium]|nr:50S ribosomal protein L11 methyltransferase [Chitinophagaceae bacterium]
MNSSRKFIQLEVVTATLEQKEILIALLSEQGFQFEEEHANLRAVIEEIAFNRPTIDKIFSEQNLKYSLAILDDKNWNAEWETSFESVSVGSFCSVRAAFHDPQTNVRHDIIVTPKMSFGTGHHATTYMMIQAMERLNFTGKHVLDFGTGTGVLAILAVKMGAGKVIAIDNDDWSIENAAENFKENDITVAELLKGDKIGVNIQFDIVLANINKNVILENLPTMKQHLSVSGVVLLGGLLESDRNTITEAIDKSAFRLLFSLERDSWICLAIS